MERLKMNYIDGKSTGIGLQSLNSSVIPECLLN
jgi:hypothetical protein